MAHGSELAFYGGRPDSGARIGSVGLGCPERERRIAWDFGRQRLRERVVGTTGTEEGG